MKAIVCAVAVLCMGCASMKYGDGKVGPVPLDPAVDALAKAIDKNAPGSGNYVREWFAASGVERVPAGYVVVWDSYLGGVKINEADIVRTPRLAVREGGNAPPVVVVTTNAGQDAAINAAVDAIIGSGIVDEVTK